VSCASSSSLKEKEKEIQKKRNIKSRKIEKRKMLVFKAFHSNRPNSFFYCIRTKTKIRKLGRGISSVNVHSIEKYYIIRIGDRYRGILLII